MTKLVNKEISLDLIQETFNDLFYKRVLQKDNVRMYIYGTEEQIDASLKILREAMLETINEDESRLQVGK